MGWELRTKDWGVQRAERSHAARRVRGHLSADRIFIDVFLLRVVDTHKRLDGFNDPLGVPDQVRIDIFGAEIIAAPARPKNSRRFIVAFPHPIPCYTRRCLDRLTALTLSRVRTVQTQHPLSLKRHLPRRH